MKIVAKALIKNSEGKILVLHRSRTHPLYAHHLDFPGGEVETNESGMDGVVREIREETGLLVKPTDTHLFIQHQISSDKVYETYTTTIDEVSPIIHVSWEHDTYTWMTETELLDSPLPDNVDDYYEMVIKYLRRIDIPRI